MRQLVDSWLAPYRSPDTPGYDRRHMGNPRVTPTIGLPMLRAIERQALRLLGAADAVSNRLYGSRFNPLYQSGTILIALYLSLLVTGLWLILFYRVAAPWESVAALTRTLGRHYFAGAYGRVLDYREHGVGYFSPDRFGMGEIRAGHLTSSHGWETRLSGGAGIQQTSGSSSQAEWHVEGRVARRWSTLNLVELFGGVTNSVASSVNGAFRYRTAGVRVVLTF